MLITFPWSEMPKPEELGTRDVSVWTSVTPHPHLVFYIACFLTEVDDPIDPISRIYAHPEGIHAIGCLASANHLRLTSVQACLFNPDTQKWALLPVEEIWISATVADASRRVFIRIRHDVLMDESGKPVEVGYANNVSLVYQDTSKDADELTETA